MAQLDTLRKELHETHHRGRMARMLELGRRAKSDAKSLALIDQLAQGDVFERRMALFAMQTLDDGGRVLAFTRDESRSLRTLAFTLVPRACTDDQALEALQVAYALRRDPDLLRQLAARKRRTVIDRYLDWLATRPGLHDFADLVPLATPEGIRRHLHRALERPSFTFWSRMARGAPGVLGELLAERLAAVEGEPDAVTRQLIERHTRDVVEDAPDSGRVLLERLFARGIKSQLATLKTLGRLRPKETLALIERFDLDAPYGTFAKRVESFDDGELARIVRRNPNLLGDPGRLEETAPLAAIAAAWCTVLVQYPTWGFALLAKISDPAQRRTAWERWSTGARDANGVIPIYRVQKLPPELRELEARRHVTDVIALHTRPAERIAYARFLPWADAEKLIAAYLGHPEGSMRGVALSVMLAIPGLRPEETALADKALAMITARKNEQDPVRGVMINALVGWPRNVWRKEHTEVIGKIIRDALDAGDLSHGTAQLAEALVVRTFRLDPAWGATWLATLIKERGTIYDARLGAHLSDDEIRAAAKELLALAKSWSARERVGQLVQLAQSLGARVKLVAGLTELLYTVARETAWSYTAYAIAYVLHEHDREAFEAQLGPMLRRWLDMGWQNEILALAMLGGKGRRPPPLHAELVEVVEKIARGHGRNEQIVQAMTILRMRAAKHFDRILPSILEKDESYVCIPAVHWHLHTQRQDLLDGFLGEKIITGRFATGKTKWLLPFASGFHRWTPPQNTTFGESLDSIIRDPERDTPSIWRCLAIHAALDSAPMEPLAKRASDKRPAIQERAIRVMARCDRGQCVPTLLECLGDARARIAIYGFRKALKDLLPDRALAILGNVAMNKVTVAKEVVRMYGELRADAAYDRLTALDQTNLHRDVRIALLRALWDHLDREPTWAIFARAVKGTDWVMASRLGDIPADRLTAKSDRRLSGLLAEVLDRPEPEARIELLGRAAYLAVSDPDRAFLTACSKRLRSHYDDEVRAAMNAILYRSTELDLARFPSLLAVAMEDPRCLHVALDVMLAVNVKARASWIGAARAAEVELAKDPRRVVLRIRTAAAAMTAHELAEWIANLGPLSSDAMDACRTIVEKLPFTELEAFGDRLAKSPNAEARRIAVWSLARDAGPERGWSPERLTKLGALQNDRSPIVAGAAQAIFPPREMKT